MLTRATHIVLRLSKMLGVALVCGIITGVVVGGLGSRLAMRIVGRVGGPQIAGRLTEDGNVIGEKTIEGTVALIVFVGIPAGVFGGLLYPVVRRWMPGRGALRGLAYGTFLLLAFGFLALEGEHGPNADFALFVSPYLGIGLFLALFPLFGWLLVPMVERLDRYVPAVFYLRPVTVIGYAILAGLCARGIYRTFVDVTALLGAA